jgi:hypothetical protein
MQTPLEPPVRYRILKRPDQMVEIKRRIRLHLALSLRGKHGRFSGIPDRQWSSWGVLMAIVGLRKWPLSVRTILSTIRSLCIVEYVSRAFLEITTTARLRVLEKLKNLEAKY